MKNKRGILRHLGTFLGILAALYTILVLSALIPNAAIENKMRSSGSYYASQPYYPNRGSGRFQSIADNRADQLLVNIAWNMGNGNPMASVIDTKYYDDGSFGLKYGLQQAVSRNLTPNTAYPQYWHGSAAFVRIFHLFTDVNGMKAIGFWLLCGLLLANVGLLIFKKHWELALCLLLSLVSVQFGNLRLSITYQSCFLLALALCPAFVLLERRGDRAITLLCVASGVLTAFFDFLTTETVALLLPLILTLAIRTKENRVVTFPWKMLAASASCWLAAYLGTFLIKWCLVSLVTGQNQFAQAMSAATERLGKAPGQPFAFGSGLVANLSVFFGSTRRVDIGRVLWGLLLSFAALFAIFASAKKPRPRKAGALAILALGLAVPARYLLLGNHSYLHEFFTYRALCASVLALLAALAVSIRLPSREGKP